MKQLLVAVVIATVVGLLHGCGTVRGKCAVQPIGEDERGVQYFRYYCHPD